MGSLGLDTAYSTVLNGPGHSEDSSVKTISLTGRTLPLYTETLLLQRWVTSHKCS